MKKIMIEDQKAINHLEATGYEANARKELLAYMVQTGVSPSDPNFQAYHKEYEAAHARNEMAKAEFERQYIQPLNTAGASITWSLNYAARELTIQGLD